MLCSAISVPFRRRYSVTVPTMGALGRGPRRSAQRRLIRK
jgi:hypothetical protein